jgi:putative transposase
MNRKRRKFSCAFKAKVALVAVRGDKTTAELAAKFGVHGNQVSAWKKQLVEGAPELFADGRRGDKKGEAGEEELYEQIGWLKKKLASLPEEKRGWIDPKHPDLSIARQCELVGLPRSTWYYKAVGETRENLALMRQIDELYLKWPFYGSRKMAEELGVNRKRVQRLMRRMGLQAIYPKRRTTSPAAGHRIYPYLLRDLEIRRPDQVWATDITYVPMRHGFLYLVAIMDWYSRYVVGWRLSNTLEGTFCLEALEDALSRGRPEIFNSDQGSQFTARAFTERLEACGVAISMDGRGRAIDNVFIERLWRSVKYEEVYLKDCGTAWEAEDSLGSYFSFYCHQRIHQALGYRTPAEVYFEAT